VKLEDVDVLGRIYTWYHSNGRSMSRIDRVLIVECSQVWGIPTLWVLPRDMSDHCSMVLKMGGWN
jgi:hypothetical protein